MERGAHAEASGVSTCIFFPRTFIRLPRVPELRRLRLQVATATGSLRLRCKHVTRKRGVDHTWRGDGWTSTEPEDRSRALARCHEHPRGGHREVASCRIHLLPPRATQVASKPARVAPPQPACPSNGARRHAARLGVTARGTRVHEPWPEFRFRFSRLFPPAGIMCPFAPT